MGHKFSASSDRVYLQDASDVIIFDTNKKLPHVTRTVSFSQNIIFPAEANNGLTSSQFRWSADVNALRQTIVLDSAVPIGSNFVLIKCDLTVFVSGDEARSSSVSFRNGVVFSGSAMVTNLTDGPWGSVGLMYHRRLDAVIVGTQLQLQAWHTHSIAYYPNIGKTPIEPINGGAHTFRLDGTAYIGRVA